MLTVTLQRLAIVLCVVFLVAVFLLVRKNRIILKYSLLWLLTCLVLLLLAIFPEILDTVSRWIGVYVPSNAFFAILLFCIFLMLISFSIIVSSDQRAIVRLTQEISVLENRIRELESAVKPAEDVPAGERA
ncbi:MAG: DUF2304 domain-containing protein [Clostridia bacterium]|nr:DUF2304 domain-containing protein [Clostridia bacterium]